MKPLPDSNWDKTRKALLSFMDHRGFRHLPMSLFEEYDLYVENKNFLTSDHIATFVDTTGKLLALKPDSTISIVKRIPNQALTGFQKFYYEDTVFRHGKESQEYAPISQIGVEIVGPIDQTANLELVDLALDCLRIIHKEYVLDISHNLFLHRLLEQAGLSYRIQKQCLAAIYSKSTHELSDILEQYSVNPADKENILTLASLHGPLLESLSTLAPLVNGPAMEEAYRELSTIANYIKGSPHAPHVYLDFSAAGDLEYYNGIVLLGYCKGSPREVLSGGRYDKLLEKMNKNNGALGFAISLSELPIVEPENNVYDFDSVIFYSPEADPAQVIESANELLRQGHRVRTERLEALRAPLDYTYENRYLYTDTLTLQEDAKC